MESVQHWIQNCGAEPVMQCAQTINIQTSRDLAMLYLTGPVENVDNLVAPSSGQHWYTLQTTTVNQRATSVSSAGATRIPARKPTLTSGFGKMICSL